VRIVNNFPACDPSDISACGLAEGLQKASGQSAIVENKPGAGGNNGAAEVATAAADSATEAVTPEMICFTSALPSTCRPLGS
jgi:tripartite-type tricarboxylate transporter receptor subunit TctC